LGIEILKFLGENFNKDAFIKGLKKVAIVTDDEVELFYQACGKKPSEKFVNIAVCETFKRKYPELSRDTSGSELLQQIQRGVVKYSKPAIDFAAASLFCEYCYVIDLDKYTFEIYKGFNKSPLPQNERFAFLNDRHNNEYYPVRHLSTYKLKSLPTDEELESLDA
jgi:hypothetical protein